MQTIVCRLRVLVLALLVTLLSLGCADTLQVVRIISADNPEEAGKVALGEDQAIDEVCSAMAAGDEEATGKVPALLRRERQRNLGAVVSALGGDAKACLNVNWNDDASRKGCESAIRQAFKKARDGGVKVAHGLAAAYGDLERVDLGALGAQIQFSVLAVDGLIRTTSTLEEEIDRVLRNIEIPVPFVGGLASSLARAGAREIIRDALAAGLDTVVRELEKHRLVHRPAMVRQACERYQSSPEMPKMAAAVLKRVILSVSDDPNRFVRRRCKLIGVREAEIEDQKEKEGTAIDVDFCAMLARFEKKAPPERLAEANLPPAPWSTAVPSVPPVAPLAVPHDALPAKGEGAALRAAAEACAMLADRAADKSASAPRCTPDTMNLLGSMATEKQGLPEAAPPTADDLVSRIDHERERHARLLIAISVRPAAQPQLTSLEDRIAALTDDIARTRSVEAFLLRRQCSKQIDTVHKARAALLAKFDVKSLDDECKGDPFSVAFDKPVDLQLATTPDAPVLQIQRTKLCAEHVEVPVTLLFPEGLFPTGYPRQNDKNADYLGKLEILFSGGRLRPEDFRGSVTVLGHADPREFRIDKRTNQELLMGRRAALVKDWLEKHGVKAKIETGHGTTPRGEPVDLPEWRTVSIRAASLFPYVDTDKDCAIVNGL